MNVIVLICLSFFLFHEAYDIIPVYLVIAFFYCTNFFGRFPTYIVVYIECNVNIVLLIRVYNRYMYYICQR